ncbi:MAG: septum formation initiator family protein [Firmicutes bacterium]|nr:septum formation initiator family protein [Bacillota bacterium]
MRRKADKGKITLFPRRKQGGYGISRLSALAGLLVLGFLLTVVVVQAFQYNRLQKELAAVELRVAEKESRNESAADEVARLTDPESGYIEVLARKWLGLVRPGEIVIQLED